MLAFSQPDLCLPNFAPAVHHFVEYSVFTMLESDMAHAYHTDSNRGMTSTDTQKNSVYYVAKQVCAQHLI